MKEKISAALNEICLEDKRSISKQIEEALPKIETARNIGNSHADIYEALKKAGINTSYSYYLNAYYRARQKTKGTGKQKRTEPISKSQAVASSRPSSTGFQFSPFKRGDESKLI